MTTVLLLTWMLLVHQAAGQTFNPGCSFSSGQCLYNVQLGHQGQCDSVKRSSFDPNQAGSQSCSCHDIDTLKGTVNSLSTTVTTLQQNFDSLVKQLNVSQGQLAPQDAEIARLQTLLAEKDRLLQKSQVELNNTVMSMNTELERLREQLANATSQLSSCRASGDGHSGVNITTPAPVDDYTTTYCDFEASDHCGYVTQTCTEDHEDCWKVGTGKQNTRSGPVEDHTFGSPHGHYLYIDPYNKPAYGYSPVLRLAKITSPEFPPAHAYCIRLFYTLNGADVGTLKVYAKVGSGSGYPVFQKSGSAGPQWNMAEISLTSEYTSSTFRLEIEGSTDSYYRMEASSTSNYAHKAYHSNLGYMAIDDMYVYNTTCSSIPACPDTTHTFHDSDQNTNSCYLFNETPSTWYDAVKTCKAAAPNGHLVSVTSQLEQDFIVNTTLANAALTTSGLDGWYTSGNDERVEGHFVWTDTGYPYALTYTDWKAGQPNNVGNAQQCLLMEYPDTGYEWGDVNCNDKHPFICEMHM